MQRSGNGGRNRKHQVMSAPDDFSFSPDDFSGVVRLFPLPNLVLFPHVMQPLHIFEPRYCELLREALAGDRFITMALLTPGWEPNYEGRPPVYSVACLGRIAAHHRLPEGSHNLLLTGLKRIEIVRELPPRKAFREAEAKLREDFYPAAPTGMAQNLRRRLRDAVLRSLPELVKVHGHVGPLTEDGVPLGLLTDLVSYMLDIPLVDKQTLLGESNVHRRAEMLLEHLARAAADVNPGAGGPLEFPPAFSDN
jgi:uncharacterized protein